MAMIGAKWRRLAPLGEVVISYLGKRAMALSDQFLAPIFDFLAPKIIFGAKTLAPK